MGKKNLSRVPNLVGIILVLSGFIVRNYVEIMPGNLILGIAIGVLATNLLISFLDLESSRAE